MKQNDSVFTSCVKKIQHPSFAKPLTIIPVGDVHATSPMHSVEGFAAARKEWKAMDKDTTWYIWMGDEHEATSDSERTALDVARFHDSTMDKLDIMMVEHCHDLHDKCAFMQGHVLGMVQGNHHWVFHGDNEKLGIVKGMTSTEYMCKLFETEWLGYLNYMRLGVDISGCKTALDIVSCHGKAGGRLVGSPINQVDHLRGIFPGADAYIMGHDHTRGAVPVSCLHAPHNAVNSGSFIIKQKRQWLCRSGCFLKGYVENEQSYPVKSLYKPTEIGYIKLETKFGRPVSKTGTQSMTADMRCWA